MLGFVGQIKVYENTAPYYKTCLIFVDFYKGLLLFFLKSKSQFSTRRRLHGFDTEAASLTEPFPMLVDCTVSTDILGDDGPSPLDPITGC
uniref:Uncharacterized protein n=1 Tax=Cucumis sativus TaxID=3659 RepID=A0A090KMF9_CUCSA|nr:uncharacterized protein [Cucumis sativus]